MSWLRSLRHSLRAGLALQRQTNEPAAALRATAGVAVVLFGALAIGGPRLATSAAMGAQMAGMATFQRSYRPRPFLALAAATGLACAVFVGYLAAPHELSYLAVLGLWAFGAGMAWSMGPTAGIVASMTVAAMVVVVTLPVSVPEAAAHAGVIAAGGVVQAALVQFVPVRRWGRQRDALADAYASMADYARRLRHEPLASFDPDPLMVAREAAALTPRQARLRPAELGGMRALVERMRPVLAALADPRVGAAEDGPERDRARELLAAAAEILDAAARSIRTGRPVPAPDRVLEALALPPGGPVLRPGPGRRAAQRLIGLLAQTNDALESPADEHDPTQGHLARPALLELLPAAVGAMRRNWTWDSPVLRHAVRCSVVVVAVDALGRALPFGHGYWAPLTAMMVMRPDFSQTYSRGVARLAGTVVGVALGTAVMVAAHPAAWVCGLLAVVAVGCAYWLMRAGYFAISGFISVYVVFLLSMDGAQLWRTVFERLGQTLLGGSLALLGYALWPTWQTVRLPERLADQIEAAGRYASAAMTAYASPGAVSRQDVRRALLAYRAARSALATSAQQSEAEPVRHRGLRPSQLTRARGALAATGRATMLLEAHAPTDPADAVPEAAPFAALLRETTATAAEAVREGRAPDFGPLTTAYEKWSAEHADSPSPLPLRAAGLLTEALDSLADALR